MASYTLPELPYSYDALEPFVDAMTMQIHHSKHHQTYVNNLNAALEKAPELAGLDLLDLNKAVGTGKVPESIATAVRNNGGGTLCAVGQGLCSTGTFGMYPSACACDPINRALEPHLFLASHGQAWRQQRALCRTQGCH